MYQTLSRQIKISGNSLQRNIVSKSRMCAASGKDSYHLGRGTLRISRSAMHGKIRARFLQSFRQNLGEGRSGILLIKGGGPFHVYNTDGELLFRQEAYMHYLFGVTEEDWYGALDVRTGRSHLFMPRLPPEYSVWMGTLKTPDDYRQMYSVDEVHYVDQLASVLNETTKRDGTKAGPVHLLHGVNTDSGQAAQPARFEGAEDFELDESSLLYDTLTSCRVVKTEEEIELLRYVNRIGSEAHVAMMRSARPGMMEYEFESTFLHYCYSQGGCRQPGYTPIAASGPNAAILHYGHAGAPNNRQTEASDMMLMDMGCEYYRYGSDITCSWPVSGKFSPEQAKVYQGVLRAHQAVLGAIKPGVAWPDMHALAYRVILQNLLDQGFLRGSVEELMEHDIGALFMPHGLGHLLGIDTHDAGGYLPGTPPRIARTGFKSLRTARILEPGIVITVEPGCYFNPSLLIPAMKDEKKSKYLVPEALEQFMSFGGIRLEDNVVVTDTGCESFTNVPRTMEDVESVMAGAPWPPHGN